MNKTKIDSIDEIVDTYGDMIYRVSLHYMKQIADAEDVTQDVLMKLMKKIKYFDDEKQQKAWILRVTINTCKDHYRYLNVRRVFSLDECFDSEEEIEHDYGLIYEVAKLPLKYRSVVYLYYYEQYNTKEIAAILNKKEATISTWLHRARKLLKNQIERGENNVG